MQRPPKKLTAVQIPTSGNFTIPEIVRLGGDVDSITVQVTVVDGTLDEFVLLGRVAAEGTTGSFVVLKNAAGTWATATTAMPLTTGNIAVLASGGTASGMFIYDVRGMDAVQFQVSADAGGVVGSVTILVSPNYYD